MKKPANILATLKPSCWKFDLGLSSENFGTKKEPQANNSMELLGLLGSLESGLSFHSLWLHNKFVLMRQI